MIGLTDRHTGLACTARLLLTPYPPPPIFNAPTQGHVRVGPNVVTDPAFLVTRSLEDFLTWVDGSKIKRAVMKYNDKLDDFDLLGN